MEVNSFQHGLCIISAKSRVNFSKSSGWKESVVFSAMATGKKRSRRKREEKEKERKKKIRGR